MFCWICIKDPFPAMVETVSCYPEGVQPAPSLQNTKFLLLPRATGTSCAVSAFVRRRHDFSGLGNARAM